MIEAGATRLYAEAAEAGSAVRAQLAIHAGLMRAAGERLRRLAPRTVVTCARGSSDHAATFAKYLIETRLGIVTASAAPSVSSLYEGHPDLAGMLLLAISQSGASPDLLCAVRSAKAAGALVMALVNAESSALAQAADCALPLCAGPELSIAATKSYIASLAGLTGLVASWAEDHELHGALEQAPELLQRAWQLDWGAAVECLRGARGLYVVARGLGLGIAQEAALKLKETCGLHAEALSAAELRHGPMALVGRDFPVLMFGQSDATLPGIEALAGELSARGARVLLAGGRAAGVVALPTCSAHPILEPMLLIQSCYRMVNSLAIARGCDPDHPPHLRKITETV